MKKLSKHIAVIVSMVVAFTLIPSSAHASGKVFVSVPVIKIPVVKIFSGHPIKYKNKYYNTKYSKHNNKYYINKRRNFVNYRNNKRRY